MSSCAAVVGDALVQVVVVVTVRQLLLEGQGGIPMAAGGATRRCIYIVNSCGDLVVVDVLDALGRNTVRPSTCAITTGVWLVAV